MNIHTLHNLQEAYLDVYEEERKLNRLEKKDLRNKKYSAAHGHGGVVDNTTDKYRLAAHDARRGVKQKKPKKVDEQVDIYDIILSHLIDEGYADCLGSAEIILEHMSDEWFDEILNEYI